MIEQMTRFLQANDIGVLATCLDDEPHCSLMAYTAAPDGRTLYLISLRSTRKYRNLIRNDRVSLLVDDRAASGPDRGRVQALTVYGRCRPVEDRTEADQARRRITERHPHLVSLANAPDACVLAVRITALLLLDGPDQAVFEQLD
ncbi:MAG: pyridoxamine 5'-phosphate oxidase family protein [Proteobacteria bacterium]|nr:pyridoxamine 5'-phosphate oxidase family protein [Pseudomonadota bacterium]